MINYADFRDTYGSDMMYGRPTPPIHIQYMASRMEINIIDNNFNAFSPVDAQPSIMINQQRRNIEDFLMFRPIAKANEIIVADYEVSQLLEMITKKQDPKQAEIRYKKRKEWRKFTREINDGASVQYEQQIDNRNNIVAQLITI